MAPGSLPPLQLLRLDFNYVLAAHLLELLGNLRPDGTLAVMDFLDVDVACGLAGELQQADGAAPVRFVEV